MKTFSVIIKIVIALAAVAGAVYIAAAHGEKIVAWCRRLLSRKSTFVPYYGDADDIDLDDLPIEDSDLADDADFE